MAGPIRYRDRETGELRDEPVINEWSMRFLYDHPLGLMLAHLVMQRPLASRLIGWFQRTATSRRRIDAFIRQLRIDVSEAEHPVGAYPTLGAFFTRRLRPGMRPVDPDPDALLSPADGRTLVYPRVANRALTVKRSRVTLARLLADRRLAEPYANGAAIVVRLSPADYHRFHFPASGAASPARAAGRFLHSVHALALDAGVPAFRNKRSITRLSTERFGELMIVEVGALVVGTIEQTYRPGPVERGAEKGMFRFGGSTIIILAEPGRIEIDADLTGASADGIETLVKVGSRIARAV